ncbi:MAG: glycosyl hydrolase [Dysgonamonadaceae bacterium]|nr:glycosyl hydrolase [Dysgonamonadaceae bacterium]MDD4399357.1 glycosyl hydrolase [Dysgonamonadaceae bacterium]
MRRFIISISLLLATTSVWSQKLEDWTTQTRQGHPYTWWHWMDGNITRHGITKDLEAMHNAGITAFQLFNLSGGIPAGTVKYLSPEWLELVKFAATEAERLGMTMGLNNGPGWSCSGGSWVTPANSMQTLTWTEIQLQGTGKEQQLQLVQPKSNRNYYQDIRVIAFPTPDIDQKIKDHDLKSMKAYVTPDMLPASQETFPADATIAKASIVDLTGMMDAQGNLKWSAPKGNWTVMRFGHTSTGTETHPANDITAVGLEVNKLSSQALDVFWHDGVQPILDYLGPLVGPVLDNILVDSYEVGSSNWTAGFDREFLKRMGYSIFDYFPAMAGYCVGSGPESERFLWDVRKVCSDVMAENFYDHFRDLCHEHGLKFSSEPYTGPFTAMRAGSSADFVMGEFWMDNAGVNITSKMAASVAHLCGKKLVGAEAFTATRDNARYFNTHADLKSVGDRFFCEGINQYVFHTYVHQPTDAAPGYTLSGYGLHFNRQNTLWSQHHYYIDYISRCQYLLQQGSFVGDILVFEGESTPTVGVAYPEAKAEGFDYDMIWTDMMYQLTVRDHLIYTPAGACYRVLMMPKSEQMTPRMLQNIKRLVDAGAMVVGKRPLVSPSLQGYPACDTQVQQLVQELWGSGKVRDISGVDALLKAGVKRDFWTASHNTGFYFIHRSCEEGEVYFICNQQKLMRQMECSFRVKDRMPELWNPLTGEIQAVQSYRCQGDVTTLTIPFQPMQSWFVVFRKQAESASNILAAKKTGPLQPLDGLEILKAEFNRFVPNGIVDNSDNIRELVRNNRLDTWCNNGNWGDPAPGIVKHMQITYTIGGVRKVLYATEGQHFTLPMPGDSGDLLIEKSFYGALSADLDEETMFHSDATDQLKQLIAEGQYVIPVDDRWAAGRTFRKEPVLRVSYKAAGETCTQDIRIGSSLDLSKHDEGITTHAAMTLDGVWAVSFDGMDAPAPTIFNQLQSLSDSQDEAIRHFSGTTTYRQQISVPKSYLSQKLRTRLELGKVVAAAEVFINGQLAGNVWCAPYCLDVTGMLHAGKNDIEIRVCNQWANHLIGEEKTGRKKTVSNSRYWNKDAQLLPAGLMGPVVLRAIK